VAVAGVVAVVAAVARVAAGAAAVSGKQGRSKMKQRLYVMAGIASIDYDRLVGRLQESGGKSKPCLAKMIKIFASPAIGILSLNKYAGIKDIIKTQVGNYGIVLGTLEIGGSPYSFTDWEEDDMYKITASLDVDYSKLAAALSKSMKNPQGNQNRKLKEALAIVEPFISETMETVPPSAMAALFNLFALEKISELAEAFGVTVELMSIEASHATNPRATSAAVAASGV
jgi:hypothetical protein